MFFSILDNCKEPNRLLALICLNKTEGTRHRIQLIDVTEALQWLILKNCSTFGFNGEKIKTSTQTHTRAVWFPYFIEMCLNVLMMAGKGCHAQKLDPGWHKLLLVCSTFTVLNSAVSTCTYHDTGQTPVSSFSAGRHVESVADAVTESDLSGWLFSLENEKLFIRCVRN